MTTTPPLRITSTHEPPPTPRHGAWHDDYVPRYATRSSQRNAQRNADAIPETPSKSRLGVSNTTPASQTFHVHPSQYKFSPPLSPQRSPEHKPITRLQVLSPDTPSTSTRSHYASSSNPSFISSSGKQSFSSDSTTMNQGMLPTPVKTPRKKMAPDGNVTGRVLFQERPSAHDDIMPTPRKARKSKRHNGLSLESFDAGSEGDRGGVQIFTDSRDVVPQLDLSEDNPFLERPAAVRPSTTRGSRASKRRKLGSGRQKDEQAEEAIQNDNGMVYVFRGKKVFKHFDDRSDGAETTTDANDVEDLKQDAGDAGAQRLLTPLTRKSIKPTRLFQSEKQKREREAQQAEQEVTDIEEGRNIDLTKSSKPATETSPVRRRSARNAAASSTHTLESDSFEGKAGLGAGEISGQESPTPQKAGKLKIGSLFDSWKRVKSGSASTPVPQSKGRKRAASVLGEGEPVAGARQSRGH